MGRNLNISKEAISDLNEIWDFIASGNNRNADGFIDELFSKCVEISKLEAVGRKRDELFPGLMSLAHKKHVIFFRREQNDVWIVRILNGARDLGSVFND